MSLHNLVKYLAPLADSSQWLFFALPWYNNIYTLISTQSSPEAGFRSLSKIFHGTALPLKLHMRFNLSVLHGCDCWTLSCFVWQAQCVEGLRSICVWGGKMTYQMIASDKDAQSTCHWPKLTLETWMDRLCFLHNNCTVIVCCYRVSRSLMQLGGWNWK